MSLHRVLPFALLIACTGSSVEVPAAPGTLAVGLLGGGAHLTWLDNSSDEDEFVVMRQQQGTDAEMRELARVPFDTVTYHDEPITSGATYIYVVIATNAAGDAPSNQATFVAP